MTALGKFIHTRRMALHEKHKGYSIRALAKRIGIHQSYLSKLERGEHAPLSQERLVALARELGEDQELLLALAGKLSERVAQLINRNPHRFLDLLVSLDQDEEREPLETGYTQRLEHRKNELEVLTRRLRDEIHNRHRLESRLAQAESEQLTILANLKDVVLDFIDCNHTLLWASHSASALTDTPVENIIGQKCYTVFHNRQTPCQSCLIRKTIDSGKIEEGSHTSPNGRHWFVRTIPIKNEFGHVLKVIRCSVDMTELETTRSALHESELRWRFALEGAQEGVWDWNTRTGSTFYSPRWKEILGFSDDEIGDSQDEWFSRIHPEDVSLVSDAMEKHIHGETSTYHCEYRLRSKDGSYKWVLARGIIIERDEHNAPLRAIGTHFDITERKEAAQQLQDREAFLAALIGGIQDGVAVLAPDMTIQFANPVLETRHHESMPLIGKKCFQAFQNRTEPCLTCPPLRCLETRQPESDIVRVQTAFCRLVTEETAYPLLDPKTGEIQAILVISRDITDKRRLESALQEVESRYKTIFDKNPTVQLLINPLTGLILNANEAACVFYGYDHETLCTMSVQHFNTLPKEVVLDKMAQALAGERNLFHFQHRIKDGSVREVESRTTAINFGKRTFLHSLIIDVTERNEAMRKLHEAKPAFPVNVNTLVQHAPIGIYAARPTGKLIFVNQALAKLHGYASPEEMLQRVEYTSRMFADPAENTRIQHLLRRMDVIHDLESLSLRSDGTQFWTSNIIRAEYDAQGEFSHYEAFVTDISMRKETDRASEDARRQLLQILENLEACVLVVNPQTGTIVYANQYLKDAVGRNCSGEAPATLLFNADTEPEFLSLRQDFRTIGDTRSMELQFSNGRWYFCHAKISSWFGLDASILVVAMDITLSKQASQLREDVDRMMRHDLKSPLAGLIALPIMIIEDENLSPESIEILQAVSDSAKKMLRLIDMSLSLYKLETGEYQLTIACLDIRKEFFAVECELKEQLRKKNLAMQYVWPEGIAPESPLVATGDGTLLPFLLSNLLKNAVEAAPENSVITISLRQNDALHISIHNFGAVPSTVRNCFFDKYVTAGKQCGTGLGTYSARLIVLIHGGEIAMKTSENEGTTITFSLPNISDGNALDT